MSNEHPKLKAALKKNILELNNCILKRRAYNKFLSLETAHGLDFFRIAITALKNDLYAGAHRVFDKHKDAASIWYIKNIAPKEFRDACISVNVEIEDLEKICGKLAHIRDRVHFHIDKKGLSEPATIWQKADVTGDEFIYLTESAHEILREMYQHLTGKDQQVPDYHGDDIVKILTAYKKAYPDAPLSI